MPGSQSRLLAGLTPTEPWRPVSGMVLFAQLASLVATGWIVWSVVASSRWHPQSLAGLVTQAFVVAMLALVSTATLMTAFQLLGARSLGFDALRTSLRTARPAVWLAPTAILVLRWSPVALGAALVLVVSTTEMLYAQWARHEGVARLPPDRSRKWLRASAYAVALGGQAAIVCLWMGVPLLAAALLCFSAAGLTLMCLTAGAFRSREPSSLPDSLLRIVLTLIFAAGLTVGSVFNSGFHSGGEPPGEAGRPTELITKLYQPLGNTEITDKSYQGVILWPEVKETQRLVAPSRAQLLSPLPPVVARTPLQIPFSGQYWMFKPPLAAPPLGSYFRRATPLALSFFTTDQKPMSMKAVQKLDHSIDLGCCRAIQLTISNADGYPGTIALELVLIDTQVPEKPAQSLGERDVLSRPNFKHPDFGRAARNGSSRISSSTQCPNTSVRRDSGAISSIALQDRSKRQDFTRTLHSCCPKTRDPSHGAHPVSKSVQRFCWQRNAARPPP